MTFSTFSFIAGVLCHSSQHWPPNAQNQEWVIRFISILSPTEQPVLQTLGEELAIFLDFLCKQPGPFYHISQLPTVATSDAAPCFLSSGQ